MGNFGSLDDWGLVGTAAAAQKSYDAFGAARKAGDANATSIAVLAIPAATDPLWDVPELARDQPWSLLDLRKAVPYLHVPLVDHMLSESAGYPSASAAVVMETREHQPSESPSAERTVFVLNRLLHGGSSVRCLLLHPVEVYPDDPGVCRWYPSGFEGISPGQYLQVYPAGFDAKTSFKTIVKDLKWDVDRQLPFFTTDIPGVAVPAGAGLHRKTDFGALAVTSEDHTPNQSEAFTVSKYAYSDGDAFGSATELYYQGDFGSMGGDEGGVGNPIHLLQDVRVFRGAVKSFDPKTGELVYDQSSTNAERLAAGRPIVNISKAVRHGANLFQSSEYPTSPGTLLWPRTKVPTPFLNDMTRGVVEIPGGGLELEVVGRFLCVDKPSEYLDAGNPENLKAVEPDPDKIKMMRRWFQITSLRDDPERGSQVLQVRVKLEGSHEGAPTLIDRFLFSPSTKSASGKPDVNILIAPGGIPYDVRDAVAATDSSHPANPVILIQPNADTRANNGLPFRTPDLDTPGDQIEQAIGPQSINPSGVRVRHQSYMPVTSVTDTTQEASFFSDNLGSAQVGCGLLVGDRTGKGFRLDDHVEVDADGKPVVDKDGNPVIVPGTSSFFRGGTAFSMGVEVQATTDIALSVTGNVRPQTQWAFEAVPHPPDAGIGLYFDQSQGPDAKKVIAWSTAGYNTLVTVGYDPAIETLRIAGAKHVTFVGAETVDLGGAALSGVAGLSNLSGTARLAHTQIDASASPDGAAIAARVTFPGEGLTGGYALSIAPNWITAYGVVEKSPDGFTVGFDRKPPQGKPFEPAKLPQRTLDKLGIGWGFDWAVYRTGS